MRSLVIGLLFASLLPLLCESTAQDMNKAATDSHNAEKTCTPSNCRLPLCKCPDTERPPNVEFDDTPMMVALTFNGVVASQYGKYVKKILHPIFKNPNGCPVQGTFFVSNSGNGTTDYCLVESLFNNNNEIAVGAPKYSCPYTDCESLGRYFMRWKEDLADVSIFEQKKNLANKAQINRSFLRGFRLPFLDQRGNHHYKPLKKYAFNYDSSVLIKPDDILNHTYRFWPHTLDFMPNYSCPTCPDKKKMCKNMTICPINGVWVVPLHYLNADVKNSCPSLIRDDISYNRLENRFCTDRKDLTSKLLEEMLIDNFKRHYTTNKAPFVINIETIWFEQFGEMLTEALVNFVNKLTSPKSDLTKKNDIYLVSISKIIEWIEYPTPINVIASKWLWDCDGTYYDYDETCETVKRLKENSVELEEMRKKNRTQALELQTEDLFRNGVLTAVIIVFILSIFFTIFYDKLSGGGQ